MQKIYIHDDPNSQEADPTAPPPAPAGPDHLRSIVTTRLNVYADFEQVGRTVKVRVRDDMGTSQFLATAADDHFWLKQYSKKKERIGDCTVYHFRF